MPESDISTKRIARIVDEIQRGQRPLTPPPTPPPVSQPVYPCQEHEMRLRRLEESDVEQTKQLGQGAAQFIRLEMGLANVAEKVGELISLLKWVAGIIGGFFILTCLGALVWVIVKSGGAVAGVTSMVLP